MYLGGDERVGSLSSAEENLCHICRDKDCSRMTHDKTERLFTRDINTTPGQLSCCFRLPAQIQIISKSLTHS